MVSRGPASGPSFLQQIWCVHASPPWCGHGVGSARASVGRGGVVPAAHGFVAAGSCAGAPWCHHARAANAAAGDHGQLRRTGGDPADPYVVGRGTGPAARGTAWSRRAARGARRPSTPGHVAGAPGRRIIPGSRVERRSLHAEAAAATLGPADDVASRPGRSQAVRVGVEPIGGGAAPNDDPRHAATAGAVVAAGGVVGSAAGADPGEEDDEHRGQAAADSHERGRASPLDHSGTQRARRATQARGLGPAAARREPNGPRSCGWRRAATPRRHAAAAQLQARR